MLKKTHLAVGTAVSLCVLQPVNIRELLIGTGAAMLGSLISDMDSDSSKTNKYMDRIVEVIALLVITLVAFSVFREQNMLSWLLDDKIMSLNVIAFVLFFVICAFGKEQPHRSFMHSLLGFFSLYGCVKVIYPIAAPYFGIAFLSHLMIDLLNRKGVRIFYPLKKGFCLGLCSASGLVNDLLLKIGLLVSLATFGYHAIRLLL